MNSRSAGTTPRAPDVSVVMPLRNASRTIGEQLEALCRQTTREFELIAVDNGSTDDSRQIVESFRDRLPDLRIIAANEGSGVSYARNQGVAAARSQRIILCDSDDVVSMTWVAALTEGLKHFELVGGGLDTSLLNSPRVRAMVGGPPADELPTAMKYLPYATGANMGFTREVFDDLRGFDESFVGGHEEVSFAWHAQRRGVRIGFVSTAVVHYRLRSDLRTVLKQRFGYGRSYAQMYAKHCSEPISRTSARHEVRAVCNFVATLPSEIYSGHTARWMCDAAWTVGRWFGGARYGVRSPL